MAGNPSTKERARLLEIENKQLREKLAQYEHEGRDKRLNHRRREYDETILDDLLEWSTEGQFLDEIVAQWGISRETFEQWADQHAELAELIPIARSRQRAAIWRTMRQALNSGRTFPAAMADRVMAMLDRDASSQADSEASGLVRVNGKMLSEAPTAAHSPAQVRT